MLSWLLLTGCPGGDEVVWRQFNNEADVFEVEVAPGDLGDPVTTDLTSNTGAVVIGTVSVTPGRGPVGTNHLLLVEVDEQWGERIGRATISSFGERGEETYELRQDSAIPGIFDLTLTSLGEEGESRVDTWTIALWEPIDAPEANFQEEQ